MDTEAGSEIWQSDQRPATGLFSFSATPDTADSSGSIHEYSGRSAKPTGLNSANSTLPQI